MFTVNTQAVRAEDKYRREVLRDQNHKTSKTTKVAVALIASAMLLAACGTAPESQSTGRDVVAAVSDNGPTWQPNLEALEPEVGGIAVNSFGVFAGPSWEPNLAELPDYMIEEDFGVFSAPKWDVNQATLDQALGINRDAGIPGDSEPQGHPNYGRLETVLGSGDQQSGPR